MAKTKESFFWTSYSDLMTSLFFIMLVLFILVIVLLHKRMEVTEAKLEAIEEVQSSTKDLSPDYFTYRSDFKKYVLKVKCFFPVRESKINLLTQSCRDSLNLAGQEIERFLKNHKENKNSTIENQYILIIEGQASRDTESYTDYNYNLSFERAYSLMKFWKNDCHINFGDNCEIQIAGSGDGRYNIKTMRDKPEEVNQRFLIHIIPKNIIEDESSEK
ncbi:MAG: hypothetical protein KBT33_11120 [Prevotellaceae bacterium]|nr:hypothetical protein [Candidatus Minthosoma equi]